MTLVDGQLHLGEADRLEFISDNEAWVVAGPAKGNAVKFHPPSGLEPQYFEMPLGVQYWDFIDGTFLPPGPVKSEYDAWLGEYEIYSWDKPVAKMKLSKKNGYLYLDDTPSSPFVLGVLFGGDGEALDFNSVPPTFANIRLIRT